MKTMCSRVLKVRYVQGDPKNRKGDSFWYKISSLRVKPAYFRAKLRRGGVVLRNLPVTLEPVTVEVPARIQTTVQVISRL